MLRKNRNSVTLCVASEQKVLRWIKHIGPSIVATRKQNVGCYFC
jgi:hypothetical protein